MIRNVKIENYKCFSDLEISLFPLTLLCGINSCGKSSVIQALLLAFEADEREKDNGIIDLMNSKYNAELYSFSEILYEDADEEQIRIMLGEESGQLELICFSEEGDNNLYYQFQKRKLDKREIWYLGSERMISKYQKRGNVEHLELGKQNEYIAFILEQGRSSKIVVDAERNYADKENILFSEQVNQWLNFILPGNQVIAATLGKDNMVSLSFGNSQRHRTNIGYGVGFVLPMLVGGLLAKTGDLLIIENPELHLHPKAQSNLARFLAMVAGRGVQVLLETHSDHIVNGVRKAIVDHTCCIKAEDTGIYFFDYKKCVKGLRIDTDAQLSDWPDDFMEQTENDLYDLRKMRLMNGNMHTDDKPEIV